jgi:formylglycine-generating enzyme required for sulfatase activity
MKRAFFILLSALYLCAVNRATAQVIIGSTDNPQPFSILEMNGGGTRGFRLPQLTTAQRNALSLESNAAAAGLQIFNTTTLCVETWNGTKWIQACPPEGPVPPPVSPQRDPSCGITPSSGSSATFTALDTNASEYVFFVDNVPQDVQESNVLNYSSDVDATKVKVKYYYPPSYLKPEMIEVSGGKFTIGAAVQTSAEGNTSSAATGSYEVELTGFWMSETEITQAQFEYVMGTNQSYYRCDGSSSSHVANRLTSNLPVEFVNWYHAIAFCNKLSIMEGRTPCYSVKVSGGNEVDWKNLAYNDITSLSTDWNSATCDFSKTGYRLPTEAEWEYAARGGRKSQSKTEQNTADYYYSGSNTVCDVACYTGNNDSNTDCGTPSYIYGTKAVKSPGKNPNELGIYDMSGNVWEWCWNWYNDSHQYSGVSTPAKDPAGPSTTGTYRVCRGGGWNSDATYCRVSSRNGFSPSSRGDYIGFRVVVSR